MPNTAPHLGRQRSRRQLRTAGVGSARAASASVLDILKARSGNCENGAGAMSSGGVGSSSAIVLDIFKTCDAGGDGIVNEPDFHSFLIGIGIPPAEVSSLLQAAGVSKDGKVEYSEFIRWLFSVAPGPAFSDSSLTTPASGALAPAPAAAAKCSIAQGSTWTPTLRHMSKEAAVGMTTACVPFEEVATQCAATRSDEQYRWEPTLSKLGPAAHNAKAAIETCEVAMVGEEMEHSSGDVVELQHQLLMSRSNSERSLNHDGEESQASVLEVDPFVPQHCLQSWEYPLSKSEKRLLYARLCDQERAAAVHQYQHLRQRCEYFRMSGAHTCDDHESQPGSDESDACEDEEGAKLQAKQRDLERQLQDVRTERRRLSLSRP